MLAATFKPEFLNRIDDMVIFHRLSREDIARIVDLQVDLLAGRVRERGIEIELTDDARTLLGNLGYDPTYGARPLKRVIQNQLVDKLALKLLEGEFAEGDVVRVDAARRRAGLREGRRRGRGRDRLSRGQRSSRPRPTLAPMRIGICAYWFNRGQGVVARQLRSALDSLGHETFVLARPTRAGNIRPSFVDRTGVWDQPRRHRGLGSTGSRPTSWSPGAARTSSSSRSSTRTTSFEAIAALRARGRAHRRALRLGAVLAPSTSSRRSARSTSSTR